jgi:hypothetical protein
MLGALWSGLPGILQMFEQLLDIPRDPGEALALRA